MKYAIIKTGGKQYQVSEKDTLEVERIKGEPNEEVTFNEVLLYKNESDVVVGKPLIPGIFVKGKIISQTQGDKIHVYKFKAKARSRRKTGHRQQLTKVLIEKIEAGKEKVVKEVPLVASERTKARVLKKKV